MSLLALDDLHLSFGGVAALAGVSLAVEAGAFFAVIGPNGAGKSTMFNLLTGALQANGGRIKFLGEDITRRPQAEMDDLVRAAGFEKVSQEIDPWGIFTVSVARRAGYPRSGSP